MYILDANVFIEASKRYYAHDFAPAFWKALETHAQTGNVATIDKVETEISKMNDPLSQWMQNSFKVFVKKSSDTDVAAEYAGMLGWVMGQSHYLQAAKDEFAKAHIADGWLMAYAKKHNQTIVTHESFDALRRNKVPMPNVCMQFGVQYIDTFELLRKLNIKFN